MMNCQCLHEDEQQMEDNSTSVQRLPNQFNDPVSIGQPEENVMYEVDAKENCFMLDGDSKRAAHASDYSLKRDTNTDINFQAPTTAINKDDSMVKQEESYISMPDENAITSHLNDVTGHDNALSGEFTPIKTLKDHKKIAYTSSISTLFFDDGEQVKDNESHSEDFFSRHLKHLPFVQELINSSAVSTSFHQNASSSNQDVIPMKDYKPYMQKVNSALSKLKIQQLKGRESAHISRQSFNNLSSDKPLIFTCREMLPNHFFAQQFDLSHPETFYKCIQHGKGYKQLELEMTNYLQMVESDLCTVLSKRNDSFFAALKDVIHLHDMLSSLFDLNNQFQIYFKQAYQNLVVNSLVSYTIYIQKAKAQQLCQKLLLIDELRKKVGICVKLVDSEQWFKAKKMAEETKTTLAQFIGTKCIEEYSKTLEKIHQRCVATLETQFVEICSGHLFTKQHGISNKQINADVTKSQDPSHQDALLDPPNHLDESEQEKKLLSRIIIELVQFNNLSSVLEQFIKQQDQLLLRVMGEYWLCASDSGKDDKSDVESTQYNHDINFKRMEMHGNLLISLDPIAFLTRIDIFIEKIVDVIQQTKEVKQFIETVFNAIDQKEKENLGQLKDQYEMVKDQIVGKHVNAAEILDQTPIHCQDVASNGSIESNLRQENSSTLFKQIQDQENAHHLSSQQRHHALETLNSYFLVHICLAHHHLQTALKIPSKEIATFSVEQVQTICKLINNFMEKCRKIYQQILVTNPKLGSNSTLNSLSTKDDTINHGISAIGSSGVKLLAVTLKSLVQNFVVQRHKKLLRKLSPTLNNENWTPSEIAPEFAHIFVILYTPESPLCDVFSSTNHPPFLGSNSSHLQYKNNQDQHQVEQLSIYNTKTNSRQLDLGKDSFVLVNSQLLFGKMLYDHLRMIDAFPRSASKITKLICDLLSLFNKCTLKLALETQEVAHAVIKSIDLERLALASQCLSLQILLIPKIKIRLEAYQVRDAERYQYEEESSSINNQHDRDEVDSDSLTRSQYDEKQEAKDQSPKDPTILPFIKEKEFESPKLDSQQPGSTSLLPKNQLDKPQEELINHAQKTSTNHDFLKSSNALINRSKQLDLQMTNQTSKISSTFALNIANLDQILQSYYSHRQEIYIKLIEIMSQRADNCFHNYRLDEGNPVPSQNVSSLASKTLTLYEILHPLLHTKTLQMLFRQIFIVYNHKIKDHLSKVQIKTPKEKEKLVKDMFYLQRSLDQLNITEFGDDLIDFVHQI